MPPRKARGAAAPAGPSTKRTRTSQGAQQQQPSIAEVYAAAAQRGGADAADAADLVLEQSVPRDLLAAQLTQDLGGNCDKYLTAWSEKCYAARDGRGVGAPAAAGGSRRAAAVAAYSKEDLDLDEDGEPAGFRCLLVSGVSVKVFVLMGCAVREGGSRSWPGAPCCILHPPACAATCCSADISTPFDAPPAALRYLEVFRHLEQQAFKHGAGFEARQLELLALMMRSDVVHALGGACAAGVCLLGLLLKICGCEEGVKQWWWERARDHAATVV